MHVVTFSLVYKYFSIQPKLNMNFSTTFYHAQDFTRLTLLAIVSLISGVNREIRDLKIVNIHFYTLLCP